MNESHDKIMFEKGYRYKIIPTNHEMESLYVKKILELGPLMREFPNIKFDIKKLEDPNMSEMERREEIGAWQDHDALGLDGPNPYI